MRSLAMFREDDMTMEREVLRTPEALKITGLHPDVWRDLTFRRLYRGAPRTSKGVATEFDLLDLTAAYCLGRMVDQLVMPSVAGKIATDILLKLRRDPTCEVPVLSAWRVKPSTKRIVVSERAPNAASIELFRFKVAEIRALMLDGIRRKLGGSAENLSGPFKTYSGRAGSEATFEQPDSAESKGRRPVSSMRTAP